MNKAWLFGVGAAAVVQGATVRGEVVRLEIKEQRDWAKGQAFKADPYEAITKWQPVFKKIIRSRLRGGDGEIRTLGTV